MARITQPITNTEAKQAKPRDKIYTLFDGGGLVLRVNPSGSKKWILNYTQPFTKKRTSISFGTYPYVTIAEARALREKTKALLEKNIDPKSHRDELDQQSQTAKKHTLKSVACDWLPVKKTKVSSDHADKLFRSLEIHIFAKLGSIPISEIKAPLVIQTLKPLAAKGNLQTVSRVCQRINEVMFYAVNTGIIDNNPLAQIREAFEVAKKKHMPTIKPEQLPHLLRSVAQASIKRTTRCLIEWQLHTMTRPSEAAGARWDELDLEKKLWIIPAERMKKGKEHSIPLTPQAIALLEVMRPISSHREYIFPSDRNSKSHTNPSTANVALKRMGFGGQLVAHGMRSIASTTLNEQGFDPDVIESALAHVDKNEVRRAYNRAEYLMRRKEMMAWWSEYIEKSSIGCLSISTLN
ncbi:MAG: integrase domain-containing protein [Oceanospirillaceae bacterium]